LENNRYKRKRIKEVIMSEIVEKLARDIKLMTNGRLLDEYNYTRNKVSGVIDGGFGRFEILYLDMLLAEIDKRSI